MEFSVSNVSLRGMRTDGGDGAARGTVSPDIRFPLLLRQAKACDPVARGYSYCRIFALLFAGFMNPLKLIALDKADLDVLSAHLQDAVLRVEDMTYLPHERRFAAVLNRFDWMSAGDGKAKQYQRRRAALRIEKVLAAQFQKLPMHDKSHVVELLAVNFEETEAPAGYVMLVFAGGGGIRLAVECIEVELNDLGPAWPARVKPEHPDDSPSGA